MPATTCTLVDNILLIWHLYAARGGSRYAFSGAIVVRDGIYSYSPLDNCGMDDSLAVSSISWLSRRKAISSHH